MADRVAGHGMAYDVCVGFGDVERSTPQEILVDFDARTRWRQVAVAENSSPTVDYAAVYQRLQTLLTSRSWRLIESIAESVAEVICTEFAVEQVTVRVTKRPFDMPRCLSVSVECSRTPADFIS